LFVKNTGGKKTKKREVRPKLGKGCTSFFGGERVSRKGEGKSWRGEKKKNENEKKFPMAGRENPDSKKGENKGGGKGEKPLQGEFSLGENKKKKKNQGRVQEKI